MPVDDVQDVNEINTEDERAAFDTVDDKDKDDKSDKKEDKDDKENEDDTKDATDDDESGDDSDSEDDEQDEEDEDKEDEESDDGDEEDAEDSVYQALKKHDPKIFKAVPELKHIIFREKEYTSVFPSVQDAKDASEAAEVFNQFSRDITSGDSVNLLNAIEKADKNGLEKFLANFMPSVQEKSNELYLQMVYPEIKKLFRAAVKSGDKNMATSARNLNHFLFQDTDVEKDAGFKPIKADPKEEELSKREQEFNRRQYDSFSTDVAGMTTRRVTRIIGAAFENSGISQFMQEKLTEEIFRQVDKEVANDKRHMGNINNLYKQAGSNGFTSEWKDRITSAYLSRAKLLIPSIRQKVLSKAGVSAKGGTKVTDTKKKPIRISSSGGQSTNRIPDKIKGKDVDWSKADERAMLDGNIPLRK